MRARALSRGPASTARRGPPSTCPLSRTRAPLRAPGRWPPDRADPLSLLRRGTGAYVDLASDYRRLHAMLVASRADAMAKAAGTPARPAPALAHRAAAARPGHPSRRRPARRPAPRRAGAARPARRSAAARAVAACRPAGRALSLRRRAGLAGGVVPAPRRRPRGARGRRRPRRQPHPDPDAARGVEPVGAQRARPLGRAARGRRRGHRRRRRDRRLPADRAAAAAPAAGPAASATTSRSTTIRPRRVLPGPVCTSFEELAAALETVLRRPGRRAGGRRTTGRSRWRSHTPTTCPAGGWSSGSDASTSTADGSGSSASQSSIGR